MKKNLPVLLVFVCLMLSLALPALAARQEGKTIADLPPAAQTAVSAALGRDNAAYHAVKIGDGFSFVLPETFQSSSMPRNSSDITPPAPPLNLRGGRVGLQERSKNVASFNKDGADVSGWRLSLAGIGRGDTLKTPSSAAPVAKGNRIEYRRGDVTEWYINGPLGLEQGFTLGRAPQTGGTGPLTLALQLPSDMKAEVEANRTDVVLAGKNKAESLRYGKLVAWDATGRRLEAWFELSPVPAQSPVPKTLSLNIRVNDKGAQYPITIDPLIQIQELTASDALSGDEFGCSVSLSGDGNTVLIGAVGRYSHTGVAYVFVRSGMTWSQQQELSDNVSNDYFGWSVSLSSDGNTALIGAYDRGVADVFVRNGTTWTQQQELSASDAASGDYFGWSVSLSGDGNTALIGAYKKNSITGAAYVFVRSGSTTPPWSQQQELSGAAQGDGFGSSVSLSSNGDTALIGATGINSYTGAAYVFVRSGSTTPPWSQQQELSGAAQGDYFGYSVSLSSDSNTALIGAYLRNTYTGAAYVFVRSGSSWSQQKELTASDAVLFGSSVSLSSDGNTALIGAYGNTSDTGAAYVFARSGTTWSQQQELTASDALSGDYFGYSVSLSSDGNTALTGAYMKNSKAGAAYVFETMPACGDGYFYNGTACEQCPIGTYQTAGYNLSCQKCPYGTWSGAGQASCSQYCDAGSYDNGSGCTQCAPGTYQTAGFNASCVQTPPGTYSSGYGGYTAITCMLGTSQSEAGQPNCPSCSPGTYQNERGQPSCIQAPAGTYVSGAAATSPTACPAGTYQPATGQTSCLSCPSNTYQPATGQTSCFAIPKAATSIIIDPSTNPSTVYAGIDTQGVYKSTDNTNWTPANGTNPNTLTNLRVKALALSTTGTLYAATYGGGVFKSDDGGANWSVCDTTNMTNLNVVSLTIDASGKLYAGTEAGIFTSSDGCSTWTATNNGLPN